MDVLYCGPGDTCPEEKVSSQPCLRILHSWGHLSKLAQRDQASSLGLGEVSAGPPLPPTQQDTWGPVVSMFNVFVMETFKHIQILRESRSLGCVTAAFLVSLRVSEPQNVNPQGLQQKWSEPALTLTIPHCIKLQGGEAPRTQGSHQVLQVSAVEGGGEQVRAQRQTDSPRPSETLVLVFVFLILYSELKRGRLCEQCPPRPC